MPNSQNNADWMPLFSSSPREPLFGSGSSGLGLIPKKHETPSQHQAN